MSWVIPWYRRVTRLACPCYSSFLNFSIIACFQCIFHAYDSYHLLRRYSCYRIRTVVFFHDSYPGPDTGSAHWASYRCISCSQSRFRNQYTYAVSTIHWWTNSCNSCTCTVIPIAAFYKLFMIITFTLGYHQLFGGRHSTPSWGKLKYR